MDFWPWFTTNISWISAKLVHKQLRKGAFDATFERKKQQPELKGWTLAISDLRGLPEPVGGGGVDEAWRGGEGGGDGGAEAVAEHQHWDQGGGEDDCMRRASN